MITRQDTTNIVAVLGHEIREVDKHLKKVLPNYSKSQRNKLLISNLDLCQDNDITDHEFIIRLTKINQLLFGPSILLMLQGHFSVLRSFCLNRPVKFNARNIDTGEMEEKLVDWPELPEKFGYSLSQTIEDDFRNQLAKAALRCFKKKLKDLKETRNLLAWNAELQAEKEALAAKDPIPTKSLFEKLWGSIKQFFKHFFIGLGHGMNFKKFIFNTKDYMRTYRRDWQTSGVQLAGNIAAPILVLGAIMTCWWAVSSYQAAAAAAAAKAEADALAAAAAAAAAAAEAAATGVVSTVGVMSAKAMAAAVAKAKALEAAAAAANAVAQAAAQIATNATTQAALQAASAKLAAGIATIEVITTLVAGKIGKSFCEKFHTPDEIQKLKQEINAIDPSVDEAAIDDAIADYQKLSPAELEELVIKTVVEDEGLVEDCPSDDDDEDYEHSVSLDLQSDSDDEDEDFTPKSTVNALVNQGTFRVKSANSQETIIAAARYSPK